MPASLLVVGSVSQTLIVDIPSAWWLTSFQISIKKVN